MSLFQIFAIFFAVFMIYVSRVKGKKYQLPTLEIYAWYFVWTLFGFLALFPNVLIGVIHFLNFGRVFDLLVVGAFVILTMLVFFMYFAMRDVQKKLETLVRKMSIYDLNSQLSNSKQKTKR